MATLPFTGPLGGISDLFGGGSGGSGGSGGGTSYAQSPEQAQMWSSLFPWMQNMFPGASDAPQKPVREAYGGGKKGKKEYKADLRQWYIDQGQGGSQQTTTQQQNPFGPNTPGSLASQQAAQYDTDPLTGTTIPSQQPIQAGGGGAPLDPGIFPQFGQDGGATQGGYGQSQYQAPGGMWGLDQIPSINTADYLNPQALSPQGNWMGSLDPNIQAGLWEPYNQGAQQLINTMGGGAGSASAGFSGAAGGALSDFYGDASKNVGMTAWNMMQPYNQAQYGIGSQQLGIDQNLMNYGIAQSQAPLGFATSMLGGTYPTPVVQPSTPGYNPMPDLIGAGASMLPFLMMA